jgi:hypothetical protein
VSDWTHARAKLAAAHRDGAGPEKIAALRAELDAARPAEQIEKIRRVVEALPPLNDAQRAQLASILNA